MVLAANIFSKTMGISEYGLSEHFFNNRTIGISNIGLASQENYQTIGYGYQTQTIRLSDIGYEKNYRLLSSAPFPKLAVH
jgi:hypothetical protein